MDTEVRLLHLVVIGEGIDLSLQTTLQKIAETLELGLHIENLKASNSATWKAKLAELAPHLAPQADLLLLTSNPIAVEAVAALRGRWKGVVHTIEAGPVVRRSTYPGLAPVIHVIAPTLDKACKSHVRYFEALEVFVGDKKRNPNLYERFVLTASCVVQGTTVLFEPNVEPLELPAPVLCVTGGALKVLCASTVVPATRHQAVQAALALDWAPMFAKVYGKLAMSSQAARMTPLMLACESGNSSVVELLIEQKADVNQVTMPDSRYMSPQDAYQFGQKTALMFAASAGDCDSIVMLLKTAAGAPQHLNAVTVVEPEDRRQTALDCALEAGQFDAAQLLADAGMTFKEKNLIVPVKQGSLRLFRSMVNARWPLGFDPRPGHETSSVDTPEIFGTCLLDTVEHGCTDVYVYLVNCGTSLVQLTQALGMAPLDYVLQRRPRFYSMAVHMLKQGLPHGGFAANVTTSNPPASLVCLPTMGIPNTTSHIAAQTIGENVVIGQAVHVDTGAVIGNNVLLGNGCHICAGAQVGNNVRVLENAVVEFDIVIPSNCIVTIDGIFENRKGRLGKRLGSARKAEGVPSPADAAASTTDDPVSGTPFVGVRDNQDNKQ